MAISTTPVSSTSGTATGTSVSITLPTYSLSNYMVLFIASNNGNSQTLGANVAGTVLANAANRLVSYRIVPQDGSQTSFTIGVSSSSAFSWWIGTFSGVDIAASTFGVGNNLGNNTTALIEIPVTTTSIISTGNELVLWAGSVNSTATWTQNGNTIFNTASGNAALMVQSGNMTADTLSAAPAAIDRGLVGTTRNESAVSIVLQASPNGVTNLLTNPSFEDAAGTSTGWETEGNTIGSPAYTKLSSGAADGNRMQQMQYAGQSGDTGKFFAIYQSPISASPGDTMTFSMLLSGSKSNASLIMGLEGFSTGQVYISESDVTITTLTGTLTKYTVAYLCPPNTVAVAAYVQANELAPNTSITVQLDKATLTRTTTSSRTIAGIGTITGITSIQL